MPVAVVVARLRQRGREISAAAAQALDGAVVVGEQQEDLADVGVRGAVQAQAVDLGAGVRALVRQHDTLVEAGQPEPRDEAAAGALAAVRAGVRLVDDDDAGQLVAHEHALVAPGAERLGGAAVRLVRRPLAGRHRQVDVDGVVRAARAQLRGLGRREYVVGWRDDVVEVDVVAVSDASEGRDVGHGSPRAVRAAA